MKTFKELLEELSPEHTEKRARQSAQVANKRASHAAKAWYKSYDETNPEYVKSGEKALKSSSLHHKIMSRFDANKAKEAERKRANMTQADKDELERKARGYGSGRYQGD